MMTIPGLALFYSGMVRKKNVLATMAQSLAAVAIVSILWVTFGYSLSFVGDGPWLGTLDRWFLAGITMDSVNPAAKTIPEALFMLYQMTFAIITVALVAGSVADRMRFSAYLLFSIAGSFSPIVPLAHWVWGGGFLASMVCWISPAASSCIFSAGVSGLVAAKVMGRRYGYGSENLSPFDLSLAVVGTGLLWVGWFGFNGGSALGANSRAVMAIIATHLCSLRRRADLGAIEWATRRKPSVLGMISGAVAGLGTITPASGFVAPWHGIIIGIIAGLVCYWALHLAEASLQPLLDDSLDVFGVHGIGGMTGTLLAGIFAASAIGRHRRPARGQPQQLLIQFYCIAVTLVWCGGVTFVLLKLVSVFVRCGLAAAGDGRPRHFSARRGVAVGRGAGVIWSTGQSRCRFGLAQHISKCLCVAMIETDIFKALADPTRRSVFEKLAGGSLTPAPCATGMEISQPAMSQHLAGAAPRPDWCANSGRAAL